MASVVWEEVTGPALPTPSQYEEYDEQLPDMTLRSEVSRGPDRTRQAYTFLPTILKLGQYVDNRVQGGDPRSQVQQVYRFYRVTLNGGSDKFRMDHPRTGTQETFRFLSPPKCIPVSSATWIMRIEVEQLTKNAE